jgi:uncharacterized small protein (DUF1192 family)
MNCDDFLPSVETGCVTRRWQARRHAARCPRCAAVLCQWSETKEALSSAEQLSPRARGLWTRSIDRPLDEIDRAATWNSAPRRSLHFAAVSGAVLLLVSAVWIGMRWESPNSKPVVVPAQVARANPIHEIDPADEFARLEAGVTQLEAELAVLEREVERLDARRQLDETIKKYRLFQD